MANSGGYNNIEEAVAEAQENESEETALTESGEISTGANSNEIFSDSAPVKDDSDSDSDNKED